MKKSKVFLFVFLVSLSISAQNKKIIFNGKVVNDSVSVENIHIVNKNSRRVALTNKAGEFEIPVKINDTLVFSAVQFERYHRIVTPQDFQKLQIIIRLKVQYNQLSEVKLQRNNVAVSLGLPNAGKKPLTKLEARINGHSKASVPIVLLTTLIGGAGGLDNLYYVLSGKRKKDRKLQNLLNQDRVRELNINTSKRIRKHFKEDFFIYTLNIPSKKIDDFIEHCNKKDIINLFNKDKILEVTEIMIQESKIYLDLSKK